MADKTSHLVLSALSRAAAEPDGLPLFASKVSAGLFPNTAAAKPIADRCLADGLLAPHRLAGPTAVTVTDKGRHFLIEQANPRAVVEDFVRVLEHRQGEIDQLLESAQRMAQHLRGLREAAAAILPKVITAKIPADADLAETLAAALKYHAAGHDCPLPTLFKALTPAPTVGAFHDALRTLHSTGRVYLHPWTGPLYSMPEPQYAMLIGHEVSYYASLRT